MRDVLLAKIRTIALLGVAACLLGGITLFSFQRRIIFPRHFTQADPQAGRNVPGLERLWIESDQGPVEAWFLQGDGVSAESPGPAVLFAHGNAELIEYWPEALSGYRRLGLSVLLPEYRGYGRSAGSPSQEAIAADFVRFHDILTKRPDVDPRRVVFHGRSIGGGAVCALAEQRRPAALILMSTFTSLADMSRRFLVPGFLILDPFDNLETLRELDVPALIIHGRRDEIIPFHHAEKLHQAARNSKLIAYDCDHNTCPPDWTAFWRDIDRFLKGAGLLPRKP